MLSQLKSDLGFGAGQPATENTCSVWNGAASEQDLAMAQTHLQRRNGCFYYRQKIPADLLVHFGQSEIVRSLRTAKRREASAAGYEQGHTWAREFARIRAGGLQTVPRSVAEAQGLLEALDALPIEQAGERPQLKQAKVLLRRIDDEFVTRTCATFSSDRPRVPYYLRRNRPH
jgi:hypothetical protein